MSILIASTVLLIAYLIIEYRRHNYYVNKIPIRIHVNGTRGKSSVTRLIAAGLRGGNIKTVAKTTGTLPRFIFEDGTEAAIERVSNPNIIEQKYVFRYAANRKPQAIVVECMAVNPLYQWVTERRFVQSTISVITNARMDHEDQMGPDLDSITMSLSNTIPDHGICFTSEKAQLPVLEHVAHNRHTRMVAVQPDGITSKTIDRFSYLEHKDNVALALAVCEHCGVDRDKALESMIQSRPDPGALKIFRIRDGERKINFYNVFAANDPSSTLMVWKMITQPLLHARKMLMINTRSDRYFRSLQLVDTFADQDFDTMVLTGERTDQLAQYARDKKIPAKKIVNLGGKSPEQIYAKVHELTHHETHVVGVGNIAGAQKFGAKIVKYFKSRAEGGLRG